MVCMCMYIVDNDDDDDYVNDGDNDGLIVNNWLSLWLVYLVVVLQGYRWS